VVLFVLALISLFTDFILADAQDKDLTAVIIVVTMVTISGILRFVQESRSDKAAEHLKAMIHTTTCALRAEQGRIEIPLAEVVVGDIVCLGAGDMIPADVRILTCKDLFVGQSSLTGESQPVEKFNKPLEFSHNNPLELNNLAFMGSNVVSGSATGIVIATGDETVFGGIAKSLDEVKVITSFEKGVNSVSWVLIRFMMIMVTIVFFLNGLTTGDWLNSLLFGLAVAVGLTPEMLPMIVTTNLAKGAVNMAKKKTVIKNLNSIQNFGAIDVLCTDKTGTITQDKIVLERYLDIHGGTDLRVLRHAYLNSYFQTGLRNLMDIAILDHAKDDLLAGIEQNYIKVDEIPFDFQRRRMSVVIKDKQEKTQVITKGAMEEMLAISSFAEYKGEVLPLTDEIRKEIINTVGSLNNDGLRVLGIAQKNEPAKADLFSVKDESNMVLIGYLAFLDPPKETTAVAIKALKEYGVNIKVLTGDNADVTKCICRQVGMQVDTVLMGTDVEGLNDDGLSKAVEETTVFAKLSPAQKARIVRTLRANGHVVGFMGDGINDASAMKEADVGISVDTAVDIAKESADVILLEKDLMVLEKGVIEGRRTFANIVKYIKMTASSNFGNMLSVLVACAFLPFLPMLPIQILTLNLIYDLSCISIPWDNVDKEYLKTPKEWGGSSIGKFMVWIGPTSSVFDIATYALMFFLICPQTVGYKYKEIMALGDAETKEVLSAGFQALFHAGWFVESLWSQTLVIHMIRTPKVPFVQSRASKYVLGLTSLAIIAGTLIPFTVLGKGIKMAALPWTFFPWLSGTILGYMLLTTILKKFYIKRYGELL
jgi:Mg2+-importing ATPase